MTDYRSNLEPCPECGLVICECNQPGPEPESDADKLRFLAEWFDAEIRWGRWKAGNRGVQEDLLRIADLLEKNHESFVAIMGASSLRKAWQISSDALEAGNDSP